MKRNKKQLVLDFNLSVVIPFYKKYKEFIKILPKNAAYLQRNGIEVILVLDEPSEQFLVLSFIRTYPFINWVILVNENEHSWRNPSKAINVGIRACTKKYIMICSPESLFDGDTILELRYTLEMYENSFAVGFVEFACFDGKKTNPKVVVPYGSLMVEKSFLEAACAYDEKFDKWGGEDDNIRAKLEYIGIKKMIVPTARLIHFETQYEIEKIRTKKAANVSLTSLIAANRPNAKSFQFDDWGHEFDKRIYSYRSNPFAYQMCKEYLKDYKYDLVDEDSFIMRRQCIALVHTYNESHYICDAIKHLENKCDGIIMVDDGSTDETYELAKSDKLICKVKKVREEFNEVQNKNILLDIISFLTWEWAFFIDADERIELFGRRLLDLLPKDRNSCCFYLVHLWDDETKYRTDLPEISPIAQSGILHRWRCFKNIGHLQITSKSKLHFKQTPFQDFPMLILPVVIKHYGMLTRKSRLSKYMTYTEIPDQNKDDYEYFLSNVVKTESVYKLESLIKDQY